MIAKNNPNNKGSKWKLFNVIVAAFFKFPMNLKVVVRSGEKKKIKENP